MHDMIPVWIDGKLQPFEKLKAHELGLRHKAVSVFILNGDKLLLQQRSAGKYHTPRLWSNACCTHPQWEEDTETCAHRRLADELGDPDLAVGVWTAPLRRAAEESRN